jgi:hypothetical protein
MAAENILLTGTGRSGTTLTCHMLNSLPDTVALFEPMKVKDFAERTPEEIADDIDEFCAEQRRSIHERGVATSKQVGGVMPSNPYDAQKTNDAGLRTKVVSKGKVAVDKPLDEDFGLVVKHISAFAAVLEKLVQRFPVYAVVRNPLPVLASWNSIDFNLRKGHIPAAERLDPELRDALASIEDPLDRQLHIMAWFHGKFRRNLPDESIIRYETIVETGGSCLGVIRPSAASLSEPLESRNLNQIYDREMVERVGERLLASEGAHWETYPKESVEQLLELFVSSAG